MLKIDDNLLQEIGLGTLPPEDKRSLLNHIYETLEMRVGMRLADQMTNEQLDEFEMYFEAKDDAGAFKWLETNFPNYKEIVNEEFEKLRAEVQQSAPQILSSAQPQPAQAIPQMTSPAGLPPQPQQFAPPTSAQPLPPDPGYAPQSFGQQAAPQFQPAPPQPASPVQPVAQPQPWQPQPASPVAQQQNPAQQPYQPAPPQFTPPPAQPQQPANDQFQPQTWQPTTPAPQSDIPAAPDQLPPQYPPPNQQ